MSPTYVGMVGAGYVGLVTAAGLAKLGHRVRVAEASPQKLNQLNQGHVPFWEPGLEELVRAMTASGRLSFHSSNPEVAQRAEILYIAVPTPASADGSSDLSIVDGVIREVATSLHDEAVVAIKSTVPPGSAVHFQELLRRHGSSAHVVSNPEFLSQGHALRQFLAPDRIVIGAANDWAAARVGALYEGVHSPVVSTDPTSAELIKYAANTFLATKISFANALATVCEEVGGHVDDVIEGMTMDPRIGGSFFRPGPGFGGSCLPKDTSSLLAVSRGVGYENPLLDAVIRVNTDQVERVEAKVVDRVPESDGVVALWGLTFKAGTDDVRESPAVELARRLIRRGITVRAYDPMTKAAIEGVDHCPDPLDAVAGADALLIATEWTEFARYDLVAVHDAMRSPVIVDARNLLDPGVARALGFDYVGVGRGAWERR